MIEAIVALFFCAIPFIALHESIMWLEMLRQ